MQLFSIGLWQLNDDGTHKLDAKGKSSPTYDNQDITAFARVWTGFTNQAQRGNKESMGRNAGSNHIDPMLLRPSWHDRFPKTKLDAGYLGLKCFLLERFLHDALFEAPGISHFADFLGIRAAP